MSNAAVGAVYEHIISEVINSARVDFEENGVDENVLQDLKKCWQAKLSGYGIAQFPWDPKPEPPAPAPVAVAQAVQQPSPATTAAYTQATLTPEGGAPGLALPGGHAYNSANPQVKDEPGTEPHIKQEPGGSAPPMAFPGGSGTAAQRAAFNLENQYGPRAAASINAIHSGLASQGAPAPQQAQQPLNPQQQYRQAMAAQTQQQQQRLPNGLPQLPQHDGAAPDAAASSSAPADRQVIDKTLHAQMAARAKQREGGGLLLPIRKATKNTGAKGKARAEPGDGMAQVDGGEDEDRDGSDLGSDLDDADDGDGDEEDEEGEGASQFMMLCMYDKVQRVKNKWKCVLKDGILNVNGREYVFHKATGEYEW